MFVAARRTKKMEVESENCILKVFYSGIVWREGKMGLLNRAVPDRLDYELNGLKRNVHLDEKGK